MKFSDFFTMKRSCTYHMRFLPFAWFCNSHRIFYEVDACDPNSFVHQRHSLKKYQGFHSRSERFGVRTSGRTRTLTEFWKFRNPSWANTIDKQKWYEMWKLHFAFHYKRRSYELLYHANPVRRTFVQRAWHRSTYDCTLSKLQKMSPVVLIMITLHLTVFNL